MNVTLSAGTLRRSLMNAQQGMSADMARPVLTTVLNEWTTSGWTMVSTDSYVLVKTDVPCESPSEALTHCWTAPFVKMVVAMLGQPGARGLDVTVEVEKDVAIVKCGGMTLSASAETWDFPNWRGLYESAEKKKGKGEAVALNSKYLAKLAKLVDPATGRRDPMRFQAGGPLDPQIVLVGEAVSALIMPVRVS